jgi:hypothetical protein
MARVGSNWPRDQRAYVGQPTEVPCDHCTKARVCSIRKDMAFLGKGIDQLMRKVDREVCISDMARSVFFPKIDCTFYTATNGSDSGISSTTRSSAARARDYSARTTTIRTNVEIDDGVSGETSSLNSTETISTDQTE